MEVTVYDSILLISNDIWYMNINPKGSKYIWKAQIYSQLLFTFLIFLIAYDTNINHRYKILFNLWVRYYHIYIILLFYESVNIRLVVTITVYLKLYSWPNFVKCTFFFEKNFIKYISISNLRKLHYQLKH